MPHLNASVRRHFLSWERPWLPQAAAWLARDWDGSGALDLASTLAVVPTQQAGRRLREGLAEFAATRGAAVFAPRVLTPEALTKQDLPPQVASPLQTLLGWIAVFRTVDLDEFRDVFPVDPPSRSFEWALRLAQTFARLQATLGESSLRLSDVAAEAGDDFEEHSRWEQISELERRHRAALASRDLVEPQAARIEATNSALFEQKFGRIVVLAAPDLAPLVVRRLVNASKTRPVDIVVFADEKEAAAFDEWGRPAPQIWEGRQVGLSDFEQRVHLCADPATQAAITASLVRQYASPAGVLAFGVADPEVAPLLENELRRVNQPVFNPEGRLMRHEGLFALLTCFGEAVRSSSFATVAALARCPDFLEYLQSRHGPEFSAARWLESLDELHARHLPIDLEAACEFASRAKLHPALVKGLEAIAELRSLLQQSSFPAGSTQALQRIFSRRQIDRTRDQDVRFEAAAIEWTSLVQECAAVEASFGALTLLDWWQLALRLYGDQETAMEKNPGALDLQGWMELLWEDAPHLVVTGLNDGHVPEAVPEDGFLPGRLRQRLGLTTNATRFARDAYIFQAVARSRANGGQLDLLYGKTTATGEPLRPSRLLLRCADEELPRRIEFLFRAPEAADANSSWTRAWKLVPPAQPPPTRVSVTGLKRYLSCPFRFYLTDVLRVESVDPMKSELDPMDFGTICHAALESIGTNPVLRDCTDARVLSTELVRRLDATVREQYGKLLSLPLLIQIESARQRLIKFAELQAAERAVGWEIVDVERSFEIEVGGLAIRGKIDRIDRHRETGAVRVLDYKTSDTAVTPMAAHLRSLRPGEEVADWAQIDVGGRHRVWSDLQLPLYLRAIGKDFPGRAACGYINLPKASSETALALWDDYSLEWHESAMHCAEQACAAIRRGEFWPPNELLDPDRDACAALFHHGVEGSVEWRAR